MGPSGRVRARSPLVLRDGRACASGQSEDGRSCGFPIFVQFQLLEETFHTLDR